MTSYRGNLGGGRGENRHFTSEHRPIIMSVYLDTITSTALEPEDAPKRVDGALCRALMALPAAAYPENVLQGLPQISPIKTKFMRYCDLPVDPLFRDIVFNMMGWRYHGKVTLQRRAFEYVGRFGDIVVAQIHFLAYLDLRDTVIGHQTRHVEKLFSQLTNEQKADLMGCSAERVPDLELIRTSAVEPITYHSLSIMEPADEYLLEFYEDGKGTMDLYIGVHSLEESVAYVRAPGAPKRPRRVLGHRDCNKALFVG